MSFLSLQKYLLCALLAFGLADAARSVTTQTSDADTVISLTQAQLLITADGRPPQTTENWQAVTLPDAWPLSRYAIADNGWYRFTIARENPPAAQWGVYLPRLTMNAAVYFNGELLGDGGSFEQPLGRNWTRPLYFKIPARAWESGDNILHIRLRTDAGVGMLAPVMTGPNTLLMPRYERAYFIQITLNAGLAVVTVVVSLFFFSLWLKRRSDSQYGWFALIAFVWSLLSLNHSLSSIPVSAFVWDWLMFSSIAWWTTGLAMFVHRYISYRQVYIEAALIGYAVLAMVLYASVGSHLWVVATVWMVGSIFIGVYAVIRLLIYRRSSSVLISQTIAAPFPAPRVTANEAGLLALGIAAVLLVGIHDWLVQNDLFYGFGEYYEHHHLLPYSAPVLILFIAWHLNRRFITALNDAEQLNTQLETRIAANRRELKSNYVQLRELESSRVVANERERIYRDLHDGLGGIATNISLLSDLAQLEDSTQSIKKKLVTISDLSREGLDEIRGFIHSLDDEAGDWKSVAADLRFNGRNLIEPHGIAFHFNPQLHAGLPATDSVLRLNLFRIYKEALTNLIKHAQAKNVTVHFEVTPQQLQLIIQDDGVGLMDVNHAHSGDAEPLYEYHDGGRGLGNLKARAQHLGGTLTLRSKQGTQVHLQVPLPIKYPEQGIAE